MLMYFNLWHLSINKISWMEMSETNVTDSRFIAFTTWTLRALQCISCEVLRLELGTTITQFSMFVAALKEHEVNDKDLMEGPAEINQKTELCFWKMTASRDSFQTGKKAFTFKSFKRIPIGPRNVVTPIHNVYSLTYSKLRLVKNFAFARVWLGMQ